MSTNGFINFGQLDATLDQEAKKLSSFFKHWDYEHILASLLKYSTLEPDKRIQIVLQEYFDKAVAEASVKHIEDEALYIQSIFPNISLNVVVKTLRSFSYERNRVSIVIRNLLLTNKKLAKRTHDVPQCETFTNKRVKVKLEVADDDYVLNGNGCIEDEDIKQTPVFNPTSMNNGTDPHSQMNPREMPYLPIINTINTGPPNVLQPMLLEMGPGRSKYMWHRQKPSNCRRIYAESDFDNCREDETGHKSEAQEEVVGYSTPIHHYDIASCSQINKDLNPMKIKLVKRQTLDGYNLYKHLSEMFSTLSEHHIINICNNYNAVNHVKPTDAIFDAIVSELLSADEDEEVSMDTELETSARSPKHTFDGCARTEKINNLGQYRSALLNHTHSRFECFPNSNATITKPVSPTPLLTNTNEILSKFLNENFSNETDTNSSTDSMKHLEKVLDDLSETSTMEHEEVSNDVSVIFTEDDYNFDSEDRKIYQTFIYPLMEMFPEACPKYIRKICFGKKNSPGVLDGLISKILDCDYPKRKKIASPVHIVSNEEQLEMMKQILPDADPNYLQIHCERLFEQPEKLKEFMANLLETRKYPTLKDYLRKQQLSAQQKQYTTDFSVQKFLEVIPDPVTYFNNSKRKAAIVEYDGFHYALCFLRNHYPRIHLNKIRETFKNSGANFLLTCKSLNSLGSSILMRSRRATCRMPEPIQDIPLLQEIAYVGHLEEIIQYIQKQEQAEKVEREEAKSKGLLQTCSCCCDDEIMGKDIYACVDGCVFCKDCIKKSAEITFGNGKLDFLCLGNCPSHFSLQTLQAVLNPKMFSKIALKKQVEEVKAAGIEDLEVCPFCDFATIPARDDKLFRCLNPECMKESCRTCKEPSHVPLRCEEVEKEDDVKKRTYIEDKMTEALLRKCYKCGMKFIKADGCNKMTCSCGAMMCYVCGQPVKDYKHFNGIGGDRYQLCPLYNDTNKLHEQAVLAGASKAKEELGVGDGKTELKYDPTMNFMNTEQGRKNTQSPLLMNEANQELMLAYQN